MQFNPVKHGKPKCSASLLQASVSHDPLEIILCWFAAQETCIIFSDVGNSCAAQYCWNQDSIRMLW